MKGTIKENGQSRETDNIDEENQNKNNPEKLTT